ncbi:hypothetical protein K438DRAFT_1971550 [Mycena galopus ATCC 62051]|nr:hypothetical protein K438DRAFT_1971550 [Mycena galopus ATCC 62051]
MLQIRHTRFHQQRHELSRDAMPIVPEALVQGREQNPFIIESALMGKRELPVDEKNMIEMLNNKIYMDKENQYLLHTKLKK